MKKHEPMTEEQLAAIKARAEAATPGPWATYDNSQDVFGREPYDWFQIYAMIDGDMWVIMRANGNMVEPEELQLPATEKTVRRKYAPGQAGKNARYVSAANPQAVLSLIHDLRACRAKLAEYERLQKRVERLRAGAKSLKSTVDFLVSNLTDRIGEEKFDEMRRDALIKKLFDAGVCAGDPDCRQVGKEKRDYDSDESGCYSCWLLWSYNMARRECEKGEEDESA